MNNRWDEIIHAAIDEWDPVAMVCLYSGGYDSMITTYLTHTKEWGIPMVTLSIDTQMSADGWVDFVRETAVNLGFKNHIVYQNKKGFNEWVNSVVNHGCPRSRKNHSIVYRYLKERAIDWALKEFKERYHKGKGSPRRNKILFVSGMRRAESDYRSGADETHRSGSSNKIFCAPIVHWSHEDCIIFRYDNDFPINPFYDTVKGSGDCQCNWGNFITMNQLKKYSPKLAAGNVALVDRISRDNHGYGWDGEPVGKLPLFDLDSIDGGEMGGFSLCSNCSRNKSKTNDSMAQVYLQRGLF